MAGTWTFIDAIANSELGRSCSSNGVVDFTQNGGTFTGTVKSGTNTCIVNSQSSTVSMAGVVLSNGQISGSSISFADNTGCTYTGTVTGNPTDQMSGDETCIVTVSGTNYTFSGTWQASR